MFLFFGNRGGIINLILTGHQMRNEQARERGCVALILAEWGTEQRAQREEGGLGFFPEIFEAMSILRKHI